MDVLKSKLYLIVMWQLSNETVIKNNKSTDLLRCCPKVHNNVSFLVRLLISLANGSLFFIRKRFLVICRRWLCKIDSFQNKQLLKSIIRENFRRDSCDHSHLQTVCIIVCCSCEDRVRYNYHLINILFLLPCSDRILFHTCRTFAFINRNTLLKCYLNITLGTNFDYLHTIQIFR